MLKKLGSDLIYLVLKTIDRLDDHNMDGYVINPEYLSVIDDRFIECTEDELKEIKKELMTELTEGDYANNEDFLENMDEVFSSCKNANIKDSVLYNTIKECFLETYKRGIGDEE